MRLSYEGSYYKKVAANGSSIAQDGI